MRAIQMVVKHARCSLYEVGGYTAPWIRVQSWAAGIDSRGQQVNNASRGAQPVMIK
jgi:hypothetical protein